VGYNNNTKLLINTISYLVVEGFNTMGLDILFRQNYHKFMKFQNFFKKETESRELVARVSKKEAKWLVKDQFSQLSKKHLSLPVSLYQL
jgi:hypothetical protein